MSKSFYNILHTGINYIQTTDLNNGGLHMKKIISILLIATMAFSQLITYAADVQTPTITFKELAKIELSDIEEISIRSGTTGEGIIISSRLVIEDILNHINNMELKEYKDTTGGGRGGWSYSVMFGLPDNNSVHYTCSTGMEINNIKYEAIDDTEVRKSLEYYYNLYKSINSSKWATDIIAEAVNLGIISADNSWNFPASICREDFCNIAVRMIEYAGVILPTENPQRPLGIKDTENINVLKLYKAGVILGKEHHKTDITFAPGDFITREEAATILYRIIKYCFWFDMPQSAYNESVDFYSDKDMISGWAFEAVFYLKELGIMSGMSDNEFSPKGSYTVEQTAATMVRLFKLANPYDNTELVSEPEQLTMADVSRLQNLVNEGHISWRTDVELVVKAFIANKTKKDAENGKIVELAGDSERCSVKFESDGTAYNLELVRPIDKTDNGVWVVEAFENEAEKEIFFHEASLEKTPVVKQDDGWYKFPEKVVAEFPFPCFHNEKPESVTAIFTPTGTEMDKAAKEIAKIEPPYMYHSMAEVLNMEISLPTDATRGHLFFRFEFEDGSVMDSQDFKVYQN